LNPSIQYDVSLRKLNTFDVEARASRFIRIESVAELVALHQSPEWSAGPRLVLGGGSNLLLTRNFEGLVVQIALRGKSKVAEDGSAWYVRAAAGENWDDFVDYTIEAGWGGLENLTRIPGTVGGAPIQNIGAYGVELVDRFWELEAFDTALGSLVTLDARECGFSYRDSVFKRAPGRHIVTSVSFRLAKNWHPVTDYGEVRKTLSKRGIAAPNPREVAEVVAEIRAGKLPDPDEIGSAGSFFKNPVITGPQHAILITRFPMLVSYLQRDGSYKVAAAWLIDQCGWKGRSIGQASVHPHQSLVLVNQGGATGADILALAHAIIESVRARFGIELEIEPVVV
jgi:UDP-N-acetylmuramate dehydrogenase